MLSVHSLSRDTVESVNPMCFLLNITTLIDLANMTFIINPFSLIFLLKTSNNLEYAITVVPHPNTFQICFHFTPLQLN